VGLAVEALVFEEEHRVVAANGGAQQAVGVEGVGGQTTRRPGMWVKMLSPDCEW
jgi:hypothetical protein